ncbi:mechanosensitive ion channel family protein [Spirosoma knui]
MVSQRWFVQILVSLFVFVAAGPVYAQDTAQVQTPSGRQSIPDTLLFKIQKAQSVITEIKTAEKRGNGVNRIRAGLADVKANVAPVLSDVQNHRQTISTKNLANYNAILNDALVKLTTWRTALSKVNNDLQSRLDQVLALSGDSLLTVASNDTTQKKLYRDQLVSLKLQLQQAGTRTSIQLDTVSRLLADVSGTSLRISNLQSVLNEQLQKSAENAFQRESPYLWDAPFWPNLNNTQAGAQSSYQGQQKILKYFFASSWDDRFLLILLTVGFFVWVFRNLKRTREPDLSQKLGTLTVDNLRPLPIVASLIFLLNLVPLFEPGSPSLYIELTQFLLLLVLTVHIWNQIARPDLRLWLLNGALYILLIVTNTLVNDSAFLRLWLIALNIAFLYLGMVYARHLHHKTISTRIIRPVTKLYLVLHGLAIVLNLFGRISLAKTFSTTAVIALIQITGLGIFIEIVLEALELQIKLSACSQGLFSRVNVDHIRRSVKKGLVLLAVGLWLLVFFINLGIADSIFGFIADILNRPRTFGSVTFSLSNVLSFAIIIYLASLLQKNIGLFFGESQLPEAGDQVDQISSVLALIRLVIIVGGVLLAVVASGISIDKFTVVLGALSVGIGLGMQTIVSNFVSGIILIFEKPFRIGDYIELADKKGRILTIGIRSSKMLTGQGSEVIIPNGDLLSNRLVNWSSNATYLKSEFTLKVTSDADLEAVREIIQSEVDRLDDTLTSMPPEVIVTGISGDTVELKVQVWIKSIYTEAVLKSKLLQQLIIRFKAAEIKLV